MRTQDDQVTSAPRAVRVSIRTAVWMVLQKQRKNADKHEAFDRSTRSARKYLHVQTSCDTSTLQWLGSTVLQWKEDQVLQKKKSSKARRSAHLFAEVDKTRHLILKPWTIR